MLRRLLIAAGADTSALDHAGRRPSAANDPCEDRPYTVANGGASVQQGRRAKADATDISTTNAKRRARLGELVRSHQSLQPPDCHH